MANHLDIFFLNLLTKTLDSSKDTELFAQTNYKTLNDPF